MNSQLLWKEFPDFDRPGALPSSDFCIYARDYTSRGGFSASECNRLISNLKKDPTLRGSLQWEHKQKAIRQYARELAGMFSADISIAAIPPSKIVGASGYDSRLEDVLEILIKLRSDLNIVHEKPIRRIRSVMPQHERKTRPSVEEIYQNLEWRNLRVATEHLVLIDDVVTVGRTYAACRRLIREHEPDITTYGFFWARTIWVDS